MIAGFFVRTFDETEFGGAIVERAHNIVHIADRHLHIDQRLTLTVRH
jgi:hypothetical protein